MSIYRTSVNHPVTTALIFVAFAILGLFSLTRLPVMVLNMGQLLSIPFVLLGIFFLVWAYKKRIPARAVHPEAVKAKKEATHYAKPLN